MRKSTVVANIESFWNKEAKNISWFSEWKKVLEWNEPFAKWFSGGMLNASHACLDVHITSWKKNKVALYWEDENGNSISLSYLQLYKQVNQCASAFKKIGVQKGDRIVLYMPMIPEAIITMLAVARVGAIHSVIFSGFGSSALADRINDSQARFIITADFGMRRGKLIPLKSVVDKALLFTSSVKNVVVVKRTEKEIHFEDGRDLIYSDILKKADSYIEPERVESNHPLFVLYTSGTTGKPKGIVHSTGGYLVYINSVFKWAFNINEESTYWCTADIGWITGHSFLVYAPLLHGASIVIYEGAPTYPYVDKWWEIIEKYSVSVFYTSPTALRMFMRYGEGPIKKHDLSSLKILGSVGEVINPEVWEWYNTFIGNKKCPIIDTWWQTETGGFMISPMAREGDVLLKPGSATYPLPGIDADVVDETGKPVIAGVKGFLVIKKPWPGMLSGVYNNSSRYKNVYWAKFKGMYYTGDYAKKDADGYFWLLGRSDETLNVAGHMLGSAEIESATLTAFGVAEAAVVGVSDVIKGEAIILFVTPKQGVKSNDKLKEEIIKSICSEIGSLARPKEIYFVSELPKTRSGKIMRRILKAIVQNVSIGDISTLEDEASVEEIKIVYRDIKDALQKTF